MIKILLSAMLAASLFAIEYNDDKLDNWRNGFITAYKAMEVDTQQQGLESKIMDVKRYVIYFDANGDDIAIWDKLMVQMFGYSSSVHKPVRTTKDWIIFASYDNKATALQELDILNDRIFKNSKRYKLQFFDNERSEIFYNDKALLTSQLGELKELLKIASEQKLQEKKKELEENQKVALIYVDKQNGEIIDISKREKVVPFVEPVVKTTEQDYSREAKPNVKSSVQETTASLGKREKENVKLVDKDAIDRDKSAFVEHKGYVKQTHDEILLFSRPDFDAKYKVKTAKKGEVIAIESKNGLNWYKVKDADLYIAGHLVKSASRDDFEKFSKQQNKIKKELGVDNKKETEIGGFTITVDSVAAYKLKSDFSLGKSKYLAQDFDFVKLIENNFKEWKYSALVEDSDGIKYVKLIGENIFIPQSSVFLNK